MRKFSSYGPIDTDLHYYVPRAGLIQQAYMELIGEVPHKGGHYITVWAPRQRGKSWVMQQVLWRLKSDERFAAAKINLQSLKGDSKLSEILHYITGHLSEQVTCSLPTPKDLQQFEAIFTHK